MKSMNSHTEMTKLMGTADCFYGTATVGERGQLVIPADARAQMGIHPGDKLMVMRHPAHMGLMIFKIEAAREFLDDFRARLDLAEGTTGEETK